MSSQKERDKAPKPGMHPLLSDIRQLEPPDGHLLFERDVSGGEPGSDGKAGPGSKIVQARRAVFLADGSLSSEKESESELYEPGGKGVVIRVLKVGDGCKYKPGDILVFHIDYFFAAYSDVYVGRKCYGIAPEVWEGKQVFIARVATPKETEAKYRALKRQAASN